MFKIWNSLRKPLIISVSILLISLFGIYIFSSPRVTGDAASHLLLAVSPILKIGVPYKDFWDIKPPTIPLVLFTWSSIFGFGINSVRFINILLPILSVSLTYLIYSKIFKTPVFEIVFLSTILVLLSPFLHSIMLPSEILGLTLSLLALFVLIESKSDFCKYFFSGFLFFLASQSKEPFTFTVLAILPIFVYSLLKNGAKKFTKDLLFFSLGIFSGFVLILIYLNSLGSLVAYKDVFFFKNSIYKLTYNNLSNNFGSGILTAERTFTEFPLGILILFILSTVSFAVVNKYRKYFIFDNSKLAIKSFRVLDSELVVKLTVIFYALGSLIGFGLSNTFSSHYLIQVVVPIYIFLGTFISYLYNNATFLQYKSKKRFYLSLVIFLFSIVIILPKRQYLKSYLPKKSEIVMKDEIYDSEKRITELTTKDQCILSIYGWGASENYLYSGRRSCTRYFLPNIVVQDWQKQEYKRSIQENPPAAIIYQTNGSDMNIEKFESEVINLSKITRNCYKSDIEVSSVFVPKDTNSLITCVRDNSN